MWSTTLANLKENLNKIALDVHDDDDTDDYDRLSEIFNSRNSSFSDRRYTYNHGRSVSPIANGLDSTSNSEIEQYKMEIKRLQESEAQIKALSVNYAALLKEREVEAMKDEVGKQVCGICLSEEGKRTVRGVLNCCRHYFCFSCIMEWSKVESRCPLCKQRFGTITKAAKSETGFDLRTVVIPIPECDQVYEPSEEELRGYLDPYESVICTECHHGGDDTLMLLCDVCDSPAHTFCVGLGRQVPEGNWYCEGCRPTVFGSLNSQRQTPISDRSVSSQTGGGFDLNELYVPETPLTQQSRFFPEPRPPVVDFPAGTVATTLRDRRRIYRQMHHRFRNNNNSNRMSDFGRSIASSSGIRLFGSQLDEARDWERPREDHMSFLSPRADPVEDSSLGMGMGMGLGFAQLRPCTNR